MSGFRQAHKEVLRLLEMLKAIVPRLVVSAQLKLNYYKVHHLPKLIFPQGQG